MRKTKKGVAPVRAVKKSRMVQIRKGLWVMADVALHPAEVIEAFLLRTSQVQRTSPRSLFLAAE